MSLERNLPRITYFNVHDDFSAVYDVLSARITELQGEVGGFFPNIVAGAPDERGTRYVAVSPIDSTICLGEFVEASPEAVTAAVAAARSAYADWGSRSWEVRVAALRRLAEVVEAHKYELAAANVLEVGKIMGEAMGEVEEGIDMIRHFCNDMEHNQGFGRTLGRAFPNEHTGIRMRPYGVFASISPFNFPVTLSIKMIVPVILCGNTVIFKPSDDAGLTGSLLMKVIREAGIPDGVVNMVCGREAGKLLTDADIDGIAFTGSHEVGMLLFRKFANGLYNRPVIAEMGGKNPVYVAPSADLDIAVEGMARSAFGLQGQKCSCVEVAYVHDDVYDAFTEKFVAYAAGIRIGDPRRRDVFMGPVINEAAFRRWEQAVSDARRDGKVLFGGERLTDGDLSRGYYVRPTIVSDLPERHWLHGEETFLPFIALRRYTDLSAAIRQGNSVKYGLTSGFYGYGGDLEYYLAHAESGLLFSNRRTGATTGAWPGYQTFPGWKGSGLTGNGGFGPSDLPQYMREQSLTLMRDSE